MSRSFSPLLAGLAAISLGVILLRVKLVSFTLFILGGYLVMRALRPQRDPYDLEELRRIQDQEREAERRRRLEELN